MPSDLNSIAENQYIFPSSAETSNPFSTQNLRLLPYYQGDRVPLQHYQNFSNWPATVDQQEPQSLPLTPQTTQTQGRVQPYGFNQNRPTLNLENTIFDTGLGLEVPMQDYPSPHSDGSVPVTSHVSPGMQYQASSAVESPENEGSTRSADLAKNDDGQFCCTHQDCNSDPPVFSRKCEYT